MIDVQRSMPAPASLAAGQKYDDDDVKERLLTDFFGKCYLTEQLVGRGGFEIDHRRPKNKNQFPELTYEWTNLFPAHPDANRRRKRKWPKGGLLDPAGGDAVERRLLQWLDEHDEPHFAAADSTDIAATNTAQELDHLHNESRPKAADLRDAIRQYLLKVYRKILAYRDMQQDGTSSSVDLARQKEEIRRMVSRRAPFTMLIRSAVGKYKYVAELFD